MTSPFTVISCRETYTRRVAGAGCGADYGQVCLMTYNPDKERRRSIRLKGYDYSRAGMYFVTICVQNRECLFGDVANGEIRLNKTGEVVVEEWEKTPQLRPNVILDEFIVMPNHFHGIVVITGSGRGVLYYAPDTLQHNTGVSQSGTGVSQSGTGVSQSGTGVSQYAPTKFHLQSPSQTIGAIIRGFKSVVTRQINEIRNTPSVKLWQRNYYEHIIRNDESLNRIREYILNNPMQWELDRENPIAGGHRS